MNGSLQAPTRSAPTAPPPELATLARADRIATTGSAVRVQGLTKRFGSRVAVNDMAIELPMGVTAGFIGPNGAGKTTTLAMLLGLVRPTAGTGSVLGVPLSNPAGYLHHVGALIETPAFYKGLSGRRNLEVLATIAGHDTANVPALLEQVSLGERGEDAFRSYSLGMKQRLGIAAALLGDPRLLILDEPTNGLDPAGTHEMRALLGSLGNSERTVFVSSHLLSELEQVCDWLVIIDRGAVLFQGPASSFLDDSVTQLAVTPEAQGDLAAMEALLAGDGYRTRTRDGALFVTIGARQARTAGADINRAAMARGVVLAEIRPVRPSLEDRYLALLTGETHA